ncbi:MAG TPA: DUF4010 domain-containing protein [Chitinophagales bacterium]|nr:DUF4010 domain-containing protein [Chitinophagales bacterium]
MIYSLFSKICLALLLGGVIGLERENSQGRDSEGIGGIRTYALVSLLGALAGLFYNLHYEIISILTIIGFILLLLGNFLLEAFQSKDFGITSELSALITFLLGLIIITEMVPLQITVTVFILLVFILSLKQKTEKFATVISQHELQSFISYAIIAVVVLPLLPNESYQFKDIPALDNILTALNLDFNRFKDLEFINPRKVWFVVVLITGIDVFGYILGKLLGEKRGFAVASFFAGFVSSTSATQSLAQRSKLTGLVFPFLGAALIANLASFIQIFMLIGPLNPKFLMSIIPGILFMILMAGILAIYFFRKDEAQVADTKIDNKPIFALIPALKFATLLIFVKLLTKVSLVVFGESGFIVSSVIASFAALDPIMVNLAEMAGKSITFKFAFITLLIVNASNLMSKTVYSFIQGNRKFALYFFISALLIIGVSFIGLFFI